MNDQELAECKACYLIYAASDVCPDCYCCVDCCSCNIFDEEAYDG